MVIRTIYSTAGGYAYHWRHSFISSTSYRSFSSLFFNLGEFVHFLSEFYGGFNLDSDTCIIFAFAPG